MFRLCLPHLERLTVESPAVSRVSFSLLAVALMATACSGGDDASVVATTVPATTVAVVEVDPLFGTVGGFVAAFTAVGGSGATSGAQPIPLTEDVLTRGPLPRGGEGFVSVEAIPSGVVGGTVDDDGAVTSVFVFLDPLTASAANAVVSLLASTMATPAQFDQVAFADVVIVNKTDLVSAAELHEVEATIRQLNPYARLIRSERSARAAGRIRVALARSSNRHPGARRGLS